MRANIVTVETAMSVTYRVRVFVDLGIQHAMSVTYPECVFVDLGTQHAMSVTYPECVFVDLGIQHAMSVTYPDCVFVDLGIQHAMRMRHIFVFCPAPLYSIFPHYLTEGTILKKTSNLKICFNFLRKFGLKHFSLHVEPSEI